MRKNKTILGFGMLTLLVLVLSISFAAAFGIGSSYWKGQPYRISPGESGTVTLYMQNMVGDEDVTVRVELKQGSEVASVDEREYTVPFGVSDAELPVLIQAPSNAQIGDTYTVVLSFVTVGEPGSGTISLGTGYDITFDVEVVAEQVQYQPEEEGGNLAVWLTLLVLVILVVVVVILVKRKKK
jgi:hypothetical protein